MSDSFPSPYDSEALRYKVRFSHMRKTMQNQLFLLNIVFFTIYIERRRNRNTRKKKVRPLDRQSERSSGKIQIH